MSYSSEYPIDFESLARYAGRYRDGPTWHRASNVVFPVRICDERFVVKTPRLCGNWIYDYYYFQDRFGGGNRERSSALSGLAEEARKLMILESTACPDLKYFEKGILIREYVEGMNWRSRELDNSARASAIGPAVEELSEIHGKGVSVGGLHAKNLVIGDSGVHWIDFDGVFDESDLVCAQALDLVRFIFSVRQTTTDEIGLISAARIKGRYPDGEVKDYLHQRIDEMHLSGTSWFAYRSNKDFVYQVARVLY